MKVTEAVFFSPIPYSAFGSRNHWYNRNTRKAPKITPATEISGRPASLYFAMGEALYKSFLTKGSKIAAIVEPR